MDLPPGMQLALARRHAHGEAMGASETSAAALAAMVAETRVNKELFARHAKDTPVPGSAASVAAAAAAAASNAGLSIDDASLDGLVGATLREEAEAETTDAISIGLLNGF